MVYCCESSTMRIEAVRPGPIRPAVNLAPLDSVSSPAASAAVTYHFGHCSGPGFMGRNPQFLRRFVMERAAPMAAAAAVAES